ncbi:MAG: NADH-quinone oxidoreductase subunit M, partial [Bdellovibrionota bacterium]
MASFETHLLCYLIFFPLAWGVLGLLIPGERGGGFGKAARYWALIGTLFTFAISLLLFVRYNPGGDEFQLLEK